MDVPSNIHPHPWHAIRLVIGNIFLSTGEPFLTDRYACHLLLLSSFVDRDMFVRYLGCGIGHLNLQAREVEEIIFEGFDAEAQSSMLNTDAEGSESAQCPDQDHEHIADEDEQEFDDEDSLVDAEELFAEL